MKLLIDTNVALDIMLNRQPHFIYSARIYAMAKNDVHNCYISASAITDIFFLSKNDLGKKPAKAAMKEMLQVFRPATVTDSHIFQALNLEWDDFEDSVQYIVGESFTADYIVTRNTQDYTSSSILAITPKQFIETVIETV